MAKITPIRISENDRKEYARLVRNARAKISRTKKNHGVDLAGEVNLPQIDDFEQRSEFNRWKQEVGSFTNRFNLSYQFVSNEYGVAIDKKTLNQIKRDRKIVQRKAREEQDRVRGNLIRQGGKPFATVEQRGLHFSLPDVTGVSVPADFDFDKVRHKSSIDRTLEMDKKRKDPKYYDDRKERMQENYLRALGGSFDSEADEIVDELKKLNPDQFYELYLGVSEMDFDSYDSDGQMVMASMGMLERIESEIEKYLKGEFKPDDMSSF